MIAVSSWNRALQTDSFIKDILTRYFELTNKNVFHALWYKEKLFKIKKSDLKKGTYLLPKELLEEAAIQGEPLMVLNFQNYIIRNFKSKCYRDKYDIFVYLNCLKAGIEYKERDKILNTKKEIKYRKMIQIRLTKKEYKLLMKILNDSFESRISMGCNEPYSDEEKIFNKKERKEIVNSLRNSFDEENEDFLFNFDYVDYIINRLKEEKEESS
jgi:hypothetical protein